MKTAVLCALLLTVLSFPALTASPTAKPEEVGLSSERLARINQMIERRIAAGDLAGAVTIVARKGKVVHHSAQGMMDLDSKKPMASSSMFRIASMTKPVIGVAVMMLVEEGKLHLNDPVSRYIPQFKDMKVAMPSRRRRKARRAGARAEPDTAPPRFYTVPAQRDVTIKDLLTHVSGLGSGPMGNSDIEKVARKDGETLADYIPRLGPTALEFQPGSRWTYSPGAGFETLGRVIEVASGTEARSVLPHAHLRSARHEGHHVLADRCADAASGHRLRSRSERTDEDRDAERHDVAERVLPRVGRSLQHGGRLHPARDDAGQRW